MKDNIILMDKLLIFILTILIALDFSVLAVIMYFSCLWYGFVKTEWTTLSSFTALLVYWVYGFLGLIFLIGSVISIICALAMFWFDMSLQDIQNRARESVNDVIPEEERKKLENIDIDNDIKVEKENVEENVEDESFINPMKNKFYQLIGMTEETSQKYQQNFISKYSRVSNLFTFGLDTFYSGLIRFRDLTNDLPIMSILYYYFDITKKEANTYIKAVMSLKELSKLSRAGFGDPNGTPDFTALQNIDMSVLMNGLEAMGMGQPSMQNADNNINSTSTSTSTSTSQRSNERILNGIGGLNGFDMNQMAELERNMTPEQKRQAEQAAMNLMQNFDPSQMGDLMNMFNGMGGLSGVSNNQNQGLNRAQRRKMNKLQKK